ncbi:MAG TPA: signal peptidase I [Noviherbaspirillum sp.]|uniref:signal peptidase I n=1 Tax=Noviherbaspirillum sp. TaxID=1926288 RepID=UPI002D4731AE|nr:signal peptidase I [Noviherbaspirillum sp.]HYD97704.1 signal peptidase I [Noviherbaspirillum sp.]
MRQLKSWFKGNKGFVFFLFGMVLVRSAVADWYGVPSGSMYPTLMIGDRIVTDRLAYDVKLPFTDVIVTSLADPQRGDIVTFTSPEDGVRLVKRVVGLPGDVVEMRGEELVVNGEKAVYAPAAGEVAARVAPDYTGQQLVLTEQILGQRHPIIVMPQRPALRSFGPVTVPPGEYLMLGDNRDASKDSRYIGFVRRELITGQVKRVAFSLDTDRYFLPRLERFGTALATP